MSPTPLPRLLVSVRSAAEAQTALRAGVDILDVKEPRRGPLGMAEAGIIADVVRLAQRFAVTTPVSAALGETLEHPASEPAAPLPAGLDFAKLGLAGLASRADWPRLWRDVRLRFDERAGRPLRWIAVAYADWDAADAPPLASVVDAAVQSSCAGLLVDTFHKNGRSLLDIRPTAALAPPLLAAREAGLLVALAGSLTTERLANLPPLRPDIVAVRGAACRAGLRSDDVDAEALHQLHRALREAFGPAEAAIVPARRQ